MLLTVVNIVPCFFFRNESKDKVATLKWLRAIIFFQSQAYSKCRYYVQSSGFLKLRKQAIKQKQSAWGLTIQGPLFFFNLMKFFLSEWKGQNPPEDGSLWNKL